ncbi:MAG TPA: methylated-DNA--[protein]-cysteine S-methyltransferase [Phycisphaerales bacterium]
MNDGGTISTRVIGSPLGELMVAASECGVRAVRFPPCERAANMAAAHAATRWLDQAERELQEYFHGRLRRFTVPIDLEGTEFQRRVWHELCRIEFGDAISYAELAKRVGSMNGFRAVGGANGANKLAIIVPCHRVVASDGTLGGYGGELWRKRWLLEHERRVAGLPPLDLFEMKVPGVAAEAAK